MDLDELEPGKAWVAITGATHTAEEIAGSIGLAVDVSEAACRQNTLMSGYQYLGATETPLFEVFEYARKAGYKRVGLFDFGMRLLESWPV